MTSKPLIGLTSTMEPGRRQHELWTAYPRSVELAGGVPLILPADEAHPHYGSYLSALGGLILTGGQDLMPQAYGEEPIAGFKADWFMVPARDGFELAIARLALETGVPVLGICRGLQVLAVAAGGALHQDVEAAWADQRLRLRHYQYLGYDCPSHSVRVAPGSLLERVAGPGDLAVNSMHHQAVSRVPEGCVVSARAADSVIEAIEPAVAGGFALGVQWHPEQLAAGHPRHLALFEALVEAAARRRSAKPRSAKPAASKPPASKRPSAKPPASKR
jgi:putative glutamine amidotransferase